MIIFKNNIYICRDPVKHLNTIDPLSLSCFLAPFNVFRLLFNIFLFSSALVIVFNNWWQRQVESLLYERRWIKALWPDSMELALILLQQPEETMTTQQHFFYWGQRYISFSIWLLSLDTRNNCLSAQWVIGFSCVLFICMLVCFCLLTYC